MDPSYWLLRSAQLHANGGLVLDNLQTGTGVELTLGPRAQGEKIYSSIHGYRRSKFETDVYNSRSLVVTAYRRS